MDPTKIPGWGVDRDPANRPGVPKERKQLVDSAAPSRQAQEQTILKSASHETLTPVFGTAAPPRGVSGLLRRVAYRIPDHRVGHWALLLAADQVDVVEGMLGDLAPHRLVARLRDLGPRHA